MIKSTTFQAGHVVASFASYFIDSKDCSMRPVIRLLASALIMTSCLTTAASHAQVAKCIDQAGHVSYSDTSCGDAVLIGYLDVQAPDRTSHATPAVLPAPVSPMAIANVPLRETAWGMMPVATKRASTDGTTIRAAREALAASDRGLAAVRMQKLADSR